MHELMPLPEPLRLVGNPDAIAGPNRIGAGVVISCDARRVEWARNTLAPLSRDELFGATGIGILKDCLAADRQSICGPDLSYVCSAKTFLPCPASADVQLRLLEGGTIAELYRYEGLHMALGYSLEGDRPDVLAVVARCDDQLAGVAGVSADSDCLWQVGIDVSPAWRGKGIGKALVARVTEAVLERGRVPYYTTVGSNLFSQRLAGGVGYRAAWTTLYSRATG